MMKTEILRDPVTWLVTRSASWPKVPAPAFQLQRLHPLGWDAIFGPFERATDSLGTLSRSSMTFWYLVLLYAGFRSIRKNRLLSLVMGVSSSISRWPRTSSTGRGTGAHALYDRAHLGLPAGAASSSRAWPTALARRCASRNGCACARSRRPPEDATYEWLRFCGNPRFSGSPSCYFTKAPFLGLFSR